MADKISLKGMAYSIHFLYTQWDLIDPADCNLDAEVRFEDGSRYCPSFFTLTNLHSLFEKNKQTGECENGLYLWSSDMILVDQPISESLIREVVAHLIAEDELHVICRQLPPDDDDDSD